MPAEPNFNERVFAAELQDFAARQDATDTPVAYSRVIRATGGGWVEIQADFLASLIGYEPSEETT